MAGKFIAGIVIFILFLHCIYDNVFDTLRDKELLKTTGGKFYYGLALIEVLAIIALVIYIFLF